MEWSKPLATETAWRPSEVDGSLPVRTYTPSVSSAAAGAGRRHTGVGEATDDAAGGQLVDHHRGQRQAEGVRDLAEVVRDDVMGP